MPLPELDSSGSREREFVKYSHEERCLVVQGWLLEGKTHRDLDKEVLDLDPTISKGWQSMGILHHLGLKRPFQGLFKGRTKNDAIRELEEAERGYVAIARYLKEDEEGPALNMKSERKCWLLCEKSEEKIISGSSEPYSDNTGELYAYDTSVPNCCNLLREDFVIIRKDDVIRGTGVISSATIIEKDADKPRKRCPTCNSTDIRLRQTKLPQWKCGNKHCRIEFADAKETVEKVDKYRATIKDYTRLANPPAVNDVKACYVNGAKNGINAQHSILELNPDKITQLGIDPLSPSDIDGLKAIRTTLELAEEWDPKDIKTARETVLRSITLRRGQPEFRRELRVAYGDKCAVTGTAAPEVLEAAHIIPYKGTGTNVINNGILLRSDWHTLFDLGYWTLSNDYRIIISDALEADDYTGYDKEKIRLPQLKNKHPSQAAVAKHRKTTFRE